MPYGNCRLLPNIRKGYKFCTPISKVHALLDQFKKFSGVVKQMGGVKELFKDEKQVKNLNPQILVVIVKPKPAAMEAISKERS